MTPPVAERQVPLPNLSIVGDRNAVNAAVAGAGGKVIQAESYVEHVHRHEANEQFFRHDLDTISLAEAPAAVRTLAARVREHSLLVLGGDYEDKPGIARQLGKLLACDGRGEDEPPRALLEWSRASDASSLLLHVARETDAVVLLTGVRPQEIAFGLEKLRAAAVGAGSRAIVTTDLPRDAWHLGPGQEALWHDLETDGLFDAGALASILVREVDGIRSALPEGALVEQPDASLSTLAGIPLRAFAHKLATPGNIAVFARQLAARGPSLPLDRPALRELVEHAIDPAQRVERWFHAALDPGAQVLALGLSLFDGLPDDQFFAAFERWLAHMRQGRDPALRAFDYGDLPPLESFFARVPGSEGETRLQSKWPGQRRALFRAAWNTHRRLVHAALEVLTGMVGDSVGARGDWELYGTGERREQIRRVVRDALADLGSISLPSVEPALLALAGRANPVVQAVAAGAVASCRQDGRDDALFALMERWQRDARLRATLAALEDGRDEREARGPYAHVRGTVAIAAGFAAQYDPPNRLIPRLVELLRELADDTNRAVRERFGGYTLPLAVSLHLAQLEPLVREMAGRYPDLRRPLGAALAYACRTAPGEVLAMLDAWTAECAAKRRAADRYRMTEREALLCVVAYAYGEMDYESGTPGAATAEAGFARLRKILAEEAHPAVRSAAVRAIAAQADDRFALVEPELQRLMGDITSDERDEVVRILTRVYLAERAALEGGTDEVEIGGVPYAVWAAGVRPLTDVERAMNRWLETPVYPAAQKTALRATLAFAQALDLAEAREVDRIRAERRASRSAEPVYVSDTAGWYSGSFVPFLATRSDPELRRTIQTLLPETAAQRDHRPALVEFVLGRWERMAGDTAATRLAGRLRSGLAWLGTAWLIPAGGALLLVWLLAKVLF